MGARESNPCQWWGKRQESIGKGGKGQHTLLVAGKTPGVYKKRWQGSAHPATLLDGTNVRLNWNIESDLNVYWIKFKNFLSLY
jgi:hypothetical protein